MDFDIGVILGSQSDQIFEEMIERHRGAKYFYENLKSYCTCGQRGCGREAMQYDLAGLFEGDRDQTQLFLDNLGKIDQQPTEAQIQATLAEMGFIVSTPSEREIVSSQLRELIPGEPPTAREVKTLLEKIFPGATFVSVGEPFDIDIDPAKLN